VLPLRPRTTRSCLTTALADDALGEQIKGCAVRTVQTLVGVAALVAAAVYWNFGTLSPCGMLRETVRQRDGLAALLPNTVVDLVLTGQYGALSPGRCLVILLNNQSTPVPNAAQVSRQPTPQPAPVTAQDPMQWAAQVTVQAANECRTKRLRGELPTHTASVQCANAPMLAAFNEAHYRYMDLIQLFAARRLELATRIDHGELTEQQGQLEIQNAYANIQEAERRRDSGVK
jgi:hypothetical protein